MLRVATWNVLHGLPVLGTGAAAASLASCAATLDADVLGVQEVDHHQPRTDGAEQVRELAEATGSPHWRFAPTVRGTPGEPGWTPADHEDERVAAAGHDTGPLYGIGLVSRLPVLQWRSTRFPAAPVGLPLLVQGEPRARVARVPDEPRTALAAVLDGPHGRLTVVTTHLSFVPGFNVRQLRALRAWAADLPRPLFLVGDFNLPGRVPSRVTRWPDLVSGASYPTPRPRAQLDHVLASGLPDGARERATGRVVALPVSDHCAAYADVDL